jgi:tetratricopeptide (TPR) repeat protein
VAAYEEAISALLAAGDERAAGVAMTDLGRVLWRHGDTQRAREVSVEAVTLLEGVRDSSLVLAYGRAAAIDALGGRSEHAIEWANKGIELAGEIGFENITRPLGMRGVARLDLGDRGGLDDMRADLELALKLGLPADDTAAAYGNLGEMVGLENRAQGRELLEAGLELSRSRGHAQFTMVSRAYLLSHLFHEGRWDELLEEADSLIESDRARGATQIETWAITDAAIVLAHRGQISKATDLVSATLPRARGIADPQTLLPVLVIGALVAYVRNDPATADTLLAEYEAGTTEASAYTDDELPIWLTTVALGVGDVARAETILSRYEPWTACGRFACVHGRALVAEAAGRAEEAAQLFAEASEGWKAWGSIPWRAYALVGLGNCGGDPAAVAAGLEVFAELGAMPVSPSEAVKRQQQV